MKKWRDEGKSIVVFLDDGIGFASSYIEAHRISSEIKEDIIASGFVPNIQKSIWFPVPKIEWLGYIIDLVEGFIAIPERRIFSIKHTIANVLSIKSVPKVINARALASIVGKIMSTNLVLGNIARVMTKAMHVCIEARVSWNATVALSSEATDELEFWYGNIDKLNKCLVGPRADGSIIVFSDASSTGFAGYIVDTGNTFAHGM